MKPELKELAKMNQIAKTEEYRETELGELPVEWEVVNVSDIAEVKYGKANPKNNGKYPVVGSGGIFSSTSKPLITYSTIVIGRKGTAGKVWLMEENCYPSDTAFYLEWRKNTNLRFIYACFLLRPLSGQHAKTTLPSLLKINVLIPSNSEGFKVVEIGQFRNKG